MRAPLELGWHPSAESSTPDFVISSIKCPISVISDWVGGPPSGFAGL
jgi:hypothetical protein